MPGAVSVLTTKSAMVGPKVSSVRSDGPAGGFELERTGNAAGRHRNGHLGVGPGLRCARRGDLVVGITLLIAVAVGVSPKNVTVPGVVPKPVPLMVMSIPGPPLPGETDSIDGRASHFLVVWLQSAG